MKKLNNKPNGIRIAPIVPILWIHPTRLAVNSLSALSAPCSSRDVIRTRAIVLRPRDGETRFPAIPAREA